MIKKETTNMFCYQCQEAARNIGCTVKGVCGKESEVANIQDLLIYTTKGLADVLINLRKQGEEISKELNHEITLNLFTTITNANFDFDALMDRILLTIELKDKLLNKLNNKENLSEAALYSETDREKLKEKSLHVGVLDTENEDVRSLRELTIYGLKGLAAYMKHANVLLEEDEEVDKFIQEALVKTMDDSLTVDELVQLVLDTGSAGVKGMALLDKANTKTYGSPEISEVNIGTRNRPGILISGHDLRDMEMLLEQTKDTGVDVYTHSEMLPANYYPAFKKYDHFVGNYGNAWWKQKEEFESFNGPILMTTNCIVPPKASYIDRLYTTGAAGYPNCK
ncbi:MAG: hydroxylamine reductase, partial [Tissierellia bacterium]|nr:hydroxylamine reductase [Tissierellia bacterium]